MNTPTTEEVVLPASVEEIFGRICWRFSVQPPSNASRRALSTMDEQAALRIVRTIESSKTLRSLDGYITYLINNPPTISTPERPSPSSLAPQNRLSPNSSYSLTPQNRLSPPSPLTPHNRPSFTPQNHPSPSSSPTQNRLSPSSYSRTPQNRPSPSLTPQKRPSPSSSSFPPDDVGYGSPTPNQFRPGHSSSWKGDSSISSSPQLSRSSIKKQLDFSKISQQSPRLQELEFRKFFLILSYIGRNKLEDAISADDAIDIVENQKKLSMVDFESNMWFRFGRKNNVPESKRVKYLDWDCGKSHLYHCYVNADGSYFFKGPYLSTSRTHLQRELGDENVLIVKFAEEGIESINSGSTSSGRSAAYSRIVEKGILVGGLWRYRFFDGGKEEKKKREKEKEKEKTKSSASWVLKCYFVRMESNFSWLEKPAYVLRGEKVNDVRNRFMHTHMVSSMAKYIARLSLILSQTIKLQVNLTNVKIETIEDIPCRDEYGIVVCDEDGETLLHTDGTGYISEDLAAVCPKEFQDAKYMKDEHLQKIIGQVELAQAISTEVRGIEARIMEPCRLFYNGSAVKGTFLVNKKLPFRTIQVRPSMVKVETDPRLLNAESFNSLEVVSVSHKPRRACLSKNLIALLSIGGVPKKFFFGLLKKAMEDAANAYTKVRPALRALLNYGDREDYHTAAKMIASGIPLDEPCLQCHLTRVAKEERKGLRGGKLPLDESFYLMGTADPTGELKSNQVCVILEHGQVNGKVLVYRNPGLHFGDIHVLNAVYVEALEHVVGNSKYGIFFSTRGQRSAAAEIANGDFDGDMYWVCINAELLKSYKPSTPWNRMYSTPSVFSKKPGEIPPEDLDRVLFQQLIDSRNQSSVAGIAADSWTALIDEFMDLEESDKKDRMREKILKLIDIYYDALDAVKSGKKVEVPRNLRADKFPHHMEKGKANEYHSKSILGQIYDEVGDEGESLIEIKKLPCFDVPVPDTCLKMWKERYDSYRNEMTEALKCGDSSNGSANDVIKKYKELLYGASEFEERRRDVDDIYNNALALYHVTYDHVMMTSNHVTYDHVMMPEKEAKKCCFAWRIAGSALCKLYQIYQNEQSIVILPSVLRQLLQVPKEMTT